MSRRSLCIFTDITAEKTIQTNQENTSTVTQVIIFPLSSRIRCAAAKWTRIGSIGEFPPSVSAAGSIAGHIRYTELVSRGVLTARRNGREQKTESEESFTIEVLLSRWFYAPRQLGLASNCRHPSDRDVELVRNQSERAASLNLEDNLLHAFVCGTKAFFRFHPAAPWSHA